MYKNKTKLQLVELYREACSILLTVLLNWVNVDFLHWGAGGGDGVPADYGSREE